jgi:hypothetical protein
LLHPAPDAYDTEDPSKAEDEEEDVEWTAHDGGDGGGLYYYNVKTKESTWDKPEGFKGEAKPAKDPTPVAWDPVEGCDWMEVRTDLLEI